MSFAEQHEASDVGKRDGAKLAWMALTLTPGMGPTRIWKAMGRLGAAERLFEASLTELEGLGMPARQRSLSLKAKPGLQLRMRSSGPWKLARWY